MLIFILLLFIMSVIKWRERLLLDLTCPTNGDIFYYYLPSPLHTGVRSGDRFNACCECIDVPFTAVYLPARKLLLKAYSHLRTRRKNKGRIRLVRNSSSSVYRVHVCDTQVQTINPPWIHFLVFSLLIITSQVGCGRLSLGRYVKESLLLNGKM